jgi:hypothetical protein
MVLSHLQSSSIYRVVGFWGYVGTTTLTQCIYTYMSANYIHQIRKQLAKQFMSLYLKSTSTYIKINKTPLCNRLPSSLIFIIAPSFGNNDNNTRLKAHFEICAGRDTHHMLVRSLLTVFFNLYHSENCVCELRSSACERYHVTYSRKIRMYLNEI